MLCTAMPDADNATCSRPLTPKYIAGIEEFRRILSEECCDRKSISSQERAQFSEEATGKVYTKFFLKPGCCSLTCKLQQPGLSYLAVAIHEFYSQSGQCYRLTSLDDLHVTIGTYVHGKSWNRFVQRLATDVAKLDTEFWATPDEQHCCFHRPLLMCHFHIQSRFMQVMNNWINVLYSAPQFAVGKPQHYNPGDARPSANAKNSAGQGSNFRLHLSYSYYGP